MKRRTQERPRSPFKRRDDFFVVIEAGGVFHRDAKDPGDPQPFDAASQGGLITCLGQLDTPERPDYLGS